MKVIYDCLMADAGPASGVCGHELAEKGYKADLGEMEG